MESLNAETLTSKVFELMDNRKYEDATKLVNEELDKFNKASEKDFIMMASIAGSYISLGDESRNLDLVDFGLKLVSEHRENLLDVVSESTLDYYEGNGFSAKNAISFSQKEYLLPKPQDVNFFFEAKCSYLRAVKKLDFQNLDEFSISVLTNFANCLIHTGRIVEALQYYDMVLKYKAGFVNALNGKGEALISMIRTTKFFKTPSLYATIYSLFSECIKDPTIPEYVKEGLSEGIAASKKVLAQMNYTQDFQKEFKLNTSEYEMHTPEVKFNIDNYLTLSEHSLYCRCNVARKDDLMIAFENYETSNIKLLQLEAYLNRMKSEFSLARTLFYEYKTKSQTDNIQYPDFKNGILDSLDVEKLRASYRVCFGILDKIAHGICALLEIPKLDKGKENIYFNSFWFKQNEERQRLLNSCDNNIHLTALYCIASDLYHKKGEMSFYKKWRNELEHGSLLTRDSDKDPFGMLNSELFPISTSLEDFEGKTLQVLRLTRAAIYSYVFCVRQELVK